MNNSEEIIQAIDYIEENIKEKLSVADIAKNVGFSQFHFIRLFTKKTGYSPYDYYRGRKITKTIEYLSDQDVKIIDAALEFGFNSPDQFTRACVAVFGVAPSIIRKQIHEKSFQGINRITKEYLHFINQQEEKPKLVEMPTLLLSGLGYIQEKDQDWMHLSREVKHFLEVYAKKQKVIYKVNWTNYTEGVGFIHFVGFLGQENTSLGQLLTKKIEKTTYFVVKIDTNDQNLGYLRDYIDHFCLPTYQLERYLPYEVETLYLDDAGRISREGLLYIPVVQKQ